MDRAVQLSNGYPVYWPNGWRPEFAGQRYPGDLKDTEREALYRKVDSLGIEALSAEERRLFEAERCFRFWHFGSM